MSDTMDLAIPTTRRTVYTTKSLERITDSLDERLLAIATNSTHRFYFAPLCWTSAVDSLVKFVLMFFPGVFLLTQTSESSTLRVQVGIVGALLTLGGMAFFLNSFKDLLGGLKIHSEGITYRSGVFSQTMRWSDLKRWNVNANAAKFAEMPSIQLWTSDTKIPQVSIYGGCLSEKDTNIIRHILQVFEPSKES